MPFDGFVYNLFLDIINSNNNGVMTHFQEHNTDIHTKLNKYNWTPLHAAAFRGNTTLVKYFLEKGASIDFQNINGSTPKTLAQEAGHFDVVELLNQFKSQSDGKHSNDFMFSSSK